MTRTEAEQERDRLAREHPDRATSRWMVRSDATGEWSVVKVALPPGVRVEPLKTTTEAKPKPPQPDDPRGGVSRNIGGYYYG